MGDESTQFLSNSTRPERTIMSKTLRFVFATLCGLFLSFFLVACGGGEDDDNNRPPLATAQEVKAVFYEKSTVHNDRTGTLPYGYGVDIDDDFSVGSERYHVFRKRFFGTRLVGNTVMENVELYDVLRIETKGQTVLDVSGSFYFLSYSVSPRGIGILVVDDSGGGEYDWGNTTLLVAGKKVVFPASFLRYGAVGGVTTAFLSDDWLIVEARSGGCVKPGPDCPAPKLHYGLYQLSTEAFFDYGEY